MTETFRTDDWQQYKMDYHDPHAALEPAEREVAVVDDALAVLREAGLPDGPYDPQKFLDHRQAVAEAFEIPWTAISPRMQRLLYAVNAAAAPANMIAAGVFCGFTFIANAGAGVGPGACYEAENLIGVEIKPDEAARAERNVRLIDPTGTARVLAADAIEVVRDFDRPIDLLYLDANGAGKGKGLYLDIVRAAWDRLASDAIILAHNSVNGGDAVLPYLEFVRDPAHCRASVNVIMDPEGLEVSIK